MARLICCEKCSKEFLQLYGEPFCAHCEEKEPQDNDEEDHVDH